MSIFKAYIHYTVYQSWIQDFNDGGGRGAWNGSIHTQHRGVGARRLRCVYRTCIIKAIYMYTVLYIEMNRGQNILWPRFRCPRWGLGPNDPLRMLVLTHQSINQSMGLKEARRCFIFWRSSTSSIVHGRARYPSSVTRASVTRACPLRDVVDPCLFLPSTMVRST